MSATSDSDHPSGISKPDRLRGLIAAITCISVYGIVGGMSGPLISLKMEAAGIGSSIIGMNAAAMAGGILFVSPFIPRLTALLGARLFLVSCLVSEIILVLCFPLTENIWLWFVIRLLMGASVCGLYVISETWINQLVSDAYRGRVLAIYATCLSLGFMIGPTLITITGIEGWLPFLTGAGILVVAILPMTMAGNSAIALGEKPSFSILKFFRLAPSLALATLLVSFFEMAAPNILPIYGVDHGMEITSAALMATFMGGGGVILLLPIGWLADKMSRMILMAICAFAAAIAALSLPWIVNNLVLLFAVLLILGGTVHGVYSCSMAILGARFKGGDLVAGNAALSMIWAIGSLTGPASLGVSMDLAPHFGVPAILALVCGAFGSFALIRHYQHQRSENNQTTGLT
jgi:MFS family permease